MYLKNKRYCIFLAAELLILLVILSNGFGHYELIYYFSGEDISSSYVLTEEDIATFGENMELLPGVYQVRVNTSLSEGQSMSMTVKADDSYYKSLRTNTIIINSENDYTDYNVYVTGKVSEAHLECNFDNTDISSLLELSVYRTPLGNRALFIIALLIFTVLDFMVMLRIRIIDGKISTKQQIVFWVLVLAVFITYFPYLTDYYFIGNDSFYYWNRIEFLKNSILNDTLFSVREQDTLFLCIPAALMTMGFSLMTSVKMFTFIIILATAWISYFSINKCVKNEYAALFGSVAYLFSPYHLFDLYNRAALGESLAMAFMPLVCCGMYLLYTQDADSLEYRKYKWYLIWGISGAIESHLISAEITLLLIAVICVLYIKKTVRRQTFIQLLEVVGITLAINAWFIASLLSMMKTNLSDVSGAAAQSEGMRLGVGIYILLISYLLWIIYKMKTDKCMLKRSSVFFFILTIITVQFQPGWKAVPCVMAAFFSAFCIKDITEENIRVFKTAVCLAALISLFSAIYNVNDIAISQEACFIYDIGNIGTQEAD
jgi:hypothetical protein